jgi:hypothetical protein
MASVSRKSSSFGLNGHDIRQLFLEAKQISHANGSQSELDLDTLHHVSTSLTVDEIVYRCADAKPLLSRSSSFSLSVSVASSDSLRQGSIARLYCIQFETTAKNQSAFGEPAG